ncbi:MAG: tryptophan-rich sensory protein [Bacillota bacterium]
MKNEKIIKRSFTFIAYIFMITLNILANALPINGINTSDVSDQYTNLFTPAGLTFSIWGLIYLLLGAYIFMQFFDLKYKTMDHKIYDKLSLYFAASSIINGLWILSWHHLYFGISLLLMSGLLLSLIKINLIIKNHEKVSGLTKTTFRIYFGWITIATIANINVFLVNLGLKAFSITGIIWTIFVLLLGLFIGTFTSYKLKSISYYLVILWGYTGILIKHISADGYNMKYPYILSTIIFSLIFILINISYMIYNSKTA